MEFHQTNRHCFIFDIDGTIANIEHRLHFIKLPDDVHMYTDWKPDWDAFNEACDLDAPIQSVINMCRLLSNTHYIIMCTGRMNTGYVEIKTRNWLAKYGIEYHDLMMRKDKDYRSDHVVKEEMLDEIEKYFHVAGVFDDRKQVVEMWRRRGLTCYNVAEGDY